MPQFIFILFVIPFVLRLLMAIYQPERLKEREGKKARRVLEQLGRIYQDPLVSKVGQRLLVEQDVQARFFVLDTPLINAVALPNGDVFIWRGLLGEVQGDEDALAAVLGHELGHVINEHFLRSVYWMALVQFVFGYFARPLGTIGRQIASRIVHSGYSKFRERQADDTAYELMCRAGYDPQGMINLFQKLAEIPNPLGILGTHPEPNKRADRIRRHLGLVEEGKTTSPSTVEDLGNVIIFPTRRS